ncbi:hypothetical protein SKAU_G00204090 [Synaphobranchus kaupii]|uniref:Immunoglobulin domain-containing protein n=1 Tax=Synaphobranchus kaupii TaxID=118154 RepID=A0A9Q1FG11_SYNKA|nr:hypothetical protein SKAU_G00204090 [Synaphobranchus kaupii]
MRVMTQTALLVVLLAVRVVWAQVNTNVRFVKARLGDEMTVVCSTELSDQDGVYLFSWSLLEEKKVLYLNKSPLQETTHKPFEGRTRSTRTFPKFSVTISNLTENDSGLYWCQYNKFNEDAYVLEEKPGEGPVTILYVTDQRTDGSLTTTGPPRGGQTDGSDCVVRDDGVSSGDMVWVTVGLSASSVLLSCVLILICVIPKVKRFHERRGQFRPRCHDGVYEEMQPKLQSQ